ncbi:HigA family addiction module antitoxin [Pararhizobium sp. O133]|uniref:HigA family addiction module antitoxin n=1 Tax=Pararhizobium sp. O133 TaxID=3449278 RepID=UPI003F6826CB
MGNILPAIHPGEILKELYLDPLEMSAGMLAKKLNVPRTRIERIVAGKTAMTTDTALRLARFYNTTPELWMSLQVSYDLKIEAERNRAEIERIPVRDAA